MIKGDPIRSLFCCSSLHREVVLDDLDTGLGVIHPCSPRTSVHQLAAGGKASRVRSIQMSVRCVAHMCADAWLVLVFPDIEKTVEAPLGLEARLSYEGWPGLWRAWPACASRTGGLGAPYRTRGTWVVVGPSPFCCFIFL